MQIMEHEDPQTFSLVGTAQLGALWRAAHREPCPAEVQRLLETALSPWGGRPIPITPEHRSFISDDHSPIEFSLALEGDRAEIRVLVEAQGSSPARAAYWRAARALSDRLEREHGADLERLHGIEELFYPEDASVSFGMWHAICFGRAEPPAAKIYLNPAARGAARACALVDEAMLRLGHGRSGPGLRALLEQSGAEPAFLSLDLARGPQARIKVYLRHPGITSGALEPIAAWAGDHPPGSIAAFCRALAGSDGPFSKRPVLTCFSFVDPRSERPAASTIHLPVRDYAPNDAVVRERVRGYMREQGLSVDVYERCLQAMARRPLAERSGLHAYVSLRRARDRGAPRLTVYLSTELFASRAPARPDEGEDQCSKRS